MEPTPELRTQLRAELVERIPEGGTDADTAFTDAEIDELLTNASHVYEAAHHGWMRKMSLALELLKAGVAERQIGTERHKFIDPRIAVDAARKMADFYYDRWQEALGKGGSQIGEIEHDDIVGSGRVRCPDVSRLLEIC